MYDAFEFAVCSIKVQRDQPQTEEEEKKTGGSCLQAWRLWSENVLLV